MIKVFATPKIDFVDEKTGIALAAGYQLTGYYNAEKKTIDFPASEVFRLKSDVDASIGWNKFVENFAALYPAAPAAPAV